MLREVATRIADSIRTVDRAARIGGEEFALILVQTDGASALEVARRTIASVARSPVAAGAVTIAVTASAGVAVLPADGRTARELFEAADRALYAAKEAGRNRVVRAGASKDGA